MRLDYPNQRLDMDTTGVANSYEPQITCSGNNVYVAWEDWRNGYGDIYFNYSTNGGATWLDTDMRLDTDTAGAHGSSKPVVTCSGNNVYVTWQDVRNGYADIFFNSVK